MAIVRKVICDCCGKDVTDDEVFHTLKVRFPTLTPEEDDGVLFGKLHLHGDCLLTVAKDLYSKKGPSKKLRAKLTLAQYR